MFHQSGGCCDGSADVFQVLRIQAGRRDEGRRNSQLQYGWTEINFAMAHTRNGRWTWCRGEAPASLERRLISHAIICSSPCAVPPAILELRVRNADAAGVDGVARRSQSGRR